MAPGDVTAAPRCTGDSFLGFLKLLSSAALAAGGLALIASNRARWMDHQDVIFLLLFIQWQTFGLTVAKMGVDQIVFAAVSRDQSLYFSLRRSFLKQVLPWSIIFSVGAFWIFPGAVCLVMGATILLDTYSLVLISDLNARGVYNKSALLNLLNYPVFFFSMLVFALYRKIGTGEVLGAFLFSSLLRAGWAGWIRICPKGASVVEPHAVYQVGIQQALNYFLFRGDQLFLGLVYLRIYTSSESKIFIPVYLFLTKFPELVAGVINIVGTVLIPKLGLLSGMNPSSSLWDLLTRRRGILILYSLGMVFGVFIYRFLWQGPPISWHVIVPFVLHALLIFPLNAATYVMIAHGYLQGLTRNLALACIVGLIFLISLLLANKMIFLGWVVPFQQGIFLVLFMRFGFGKRQSIYG